MLTIDELLKKDTMPEWADISLSLYKEFSITCLFPKTFRYYLVNGVEINIEFKEWAMHHLWAIHHINYKISKDELFEKIDDGLVFADFTQIKSMKKRLINYRDRIRMFSCVYHILKTGNLFYVEGGKLKNSDIKIDYLKSKIISTKGVNLGVRLEEGVYVPITMLIDRAINPTETTEELDELKVLKLEIIEDGKIVETVLY